MPEYEARYTVYADYVESMTLMPDSEPHHRSLRFYAQNDEKARIIEVQRRPEAGQGLLGTVNITLDSLMQVRDVRTEPLEPEQLAFKFPRQDL